MNTPVKKIRLLVQQADTQAALAELLSLFQDKTAYREHYRIASLFQSEYENIRQQELSGLLTTNEFQVAENRLRDRILKLTDALTEPDLLGELRTHYPPAGRTFSPWMILPLLLLLGTIAYFSGLFTTTGQSFHLSVLFYEDPAKSRLVQDGRFRFVYNGRSEEKTSNEDGQVFLTDLPAGLRSETLFIHPDVAGYDKARLAFPFPQDQDYLQVVLSPTQEKVQLKGRVFDQHNRPLAGARIDIEGHVTHSGAEGDFSLELPYSEDPERLVRISSDGTNVYEAYETIGNLPVRISVNVDQ